MICNVTTKELKMVTWHTRKRHSAAATGLIILSALSVSLIAQSGPCPSQGSVWQTVDHDRPVQSTALTVAGVSQSCIDTEDLNDPDIPQGILSNPSHPNMTPGFVPLTQNRMSVKFKAIDVLALAPGRSPPLHS